MPTLRVKYLVLDLKARRERSTYKKAIHEVVIEDAPDTDDLGEIGQWLHDRDGYSARHFVKVIGTERE